MLVASRPIAPEHPPFIVAEAGLNHNGDMIRALAMIRVAKEAGCDAIKFQTFKAEGVCSPDQVYTYRSQGGEVTEPRINIFRRSELPESAWPVLKAECERQGIIFMSTPQNPSDFDILQRVGIPAVKIGSDDLTNEPMLRHCSQDERLPIILSCGMSGMEEVRTALKTVGAFRGRPTALLVCTSQYPCPPEEANLLRVQILRAIFPEIAIGFSDHTVGSEATCAAVALRACVFEKHFTLSHDLPGPDHWHACDPGELRAWVDAIRTTYKMLGNGLVEPSEREREMKAKYQRKGPA